MEGGVEKLEDQLATYGFWIGRRGPGLFQMDDCGGGERCKATQGEGITETCPGGGGGFSGSFGIRVDEDFPNGGQGRGGEKWRNKEKEIHERIIIEEISAPAQPRRIS